MMLWVLGLAFSLCGLFIWLEFGIMYPRSGGEKVYLEAVYRRPKHLSTVIFAVNAILLNFSSANCIVSLENVYIMSDMHFASGFRREVRLWCSSPPYTRHKSNKHCHSRRTWCWYLGGTWDSGRRCVVSFLTEVPILMIRAVIFFTVFLHGLTPRLGVYAMNASGVFIPSSTKRLQLCQALTLFKVVVLVVIVVTSKPPRFSG